MVLFGAVVVLAMLTLAALSLWALHAGAEPPHLERMRRVVLAVAVVLLAVVSYLGAAFFHGTVSALRALQAPVARMAEGDFAARVSVPGQDELATIGRTLEE